MNSKGPNLKDVLWRLLGIEIWDFIGHWRLDLENWWLRRVTTFRSNVSVR
jgi:hypothetical protein